MKTYERANRRDYLAALFCTLLSSVFAVVLQFFKGAVLDCALAGQMEKAVCYALLLITFILLEVGGYYLFMRFSDRYAIGCISALRQDIFDSILQRDFVTYRQRPQGEYIAKFMSEAETIRDRLFRMKPMLWEILFKVLLVAGALFRLDWRIAILTIFLLTTPLYIPKLIEGRLQKAQTAYLSAMEENLTKVTDWLSGFEVIKNFSVEDQIRDRFRSANGDAMAKLRCDTRLGAISQLLTTLISYLSYYIVLVFSGALVLAGDFSAGDFFIAIGMIDQLSWPLISLSNIIRQLLSVKPVCKAMEDFLQEAVKAPPTPSPAVLDTAIQFREVSFSYDGQRPILSKFCLTVKKGEKCLIKGPSGCGKTTAVNLLLRYFDASEGSIALNGVPIETYSSTYGLMTVVRQEATLFRDTLRNNLTLYQPISDERLLMALKRVGLLHLIDSLDALVDEGGSNYSGGEKKRICLARALLRDTEVLLLDEPLANLDDTTAERIEDLLLSIPGKTMIVVSHQFTESKLPLFDHLVEMH